MCIRPPLSLSLLLVLAAPAAFAQDHCLVGAWQPEGNAIAEWMQRRHPGMPMQIRHDSARLVFHADGRYDADLRGQARAEGPAGIAARMQGQFGGSGHWSTTGETLELRQGQDRSQAELEVTSRAGASSRGRMPTGQAQSQLYSYRCEGDRFETRMTMPGTRDVVIQPYRRQQG